MRLLRVLGPGPVGPRPLRQVTGAVLVCDVLAQFLDRLARQGHGIRAHVGDQADRPLPEVDALVQLLCDPHRPGGGEPELAHGLLLQGRGGERRGGIAVALLFLDRGDEQLSTVGRLEIFPGVAGILLFTGPPLEFRPGLGGILLVVEIELLELAVPVAFQFRGEGLAVLLAVRLEGPVLAGHEFLDLVLALADQPQGRALHPPGRQAGLDLPPQQRGEVETDQVIHGPSRLLGIDQRIGKAARVLDRILYGPPGDFMEHHPVHGFPVQHAPVFQQFEQVPGDGLAFPVRVRGEVQGGGSLEGTRDGGDMLPVLLDDLVTHGEILVRVDRAVLGHQVPHMPVGCKHGVLAAQVFLQGAGLGRGFHDD